MTRMPAVDVYEDNHDVVIKAEIPGTLEGGHQRAGDRRDSDDQGEKKREEAIKEEDYYCCERSFGAFTRTVDLPCDVKAGEVKASVKNGVLEVRLPKTDEAKKRAITVKID